MRAFVAMPFNPSFLPVWRAIKEACKINGIKPIRVDHLPQVDNIHRQLLNDSLRKAKVLRQLVDDSLRRAKVLRQKTL